MCILKIYIPPVVLSHARGHPHAHPHHTPTPSAEQRCVSLGFMSDDLAAPLQSGASYRTIAHL